MEPSFALITAWICTGMLSIRWSHVLSSKSVHILITTCFIALTEVIWPYSFAIQLFMSAHMFSIGLRSGELDRCWHLIPNSFLTGIQPFLWTGALSSITIGSSTSPKDFFQNSLSGSVKIWSQYTIELTVLSSSESKTLRVPFFPI